MYITISEENRVALEELKIEAILIKQEATELSISLLIQIRTIMFQFLLSYKEYSLTNIREYGLAEILMSRAIRFFKLDQRNEKPKKSKEKMKSKFRLRFKTRPQSKVYSRKKTRKGHKYIIKKIFKVLLFPFYIFILILEILLESKSKKKSNNSLKNTYRG